MVPIVDNNGVDEDPTDGHDPHNKEVVDVVNNSSNNLTSVFKVVHEHEQHNPLPWWMKFGIPVIFAICIAIMLTNVQDIQILQQHWIWVVSGITLALIVFESTQSHTTTISNNDKTELIVTVCPLGVQRSIISYLKRKNRQQQIQHQQHHPLLLVGCIHDCILLEHVEAFSVSTHVMFRIRKRPKKKSEKESKDDWNEENASLQLVPAFPNARLSFDQCHSLRNQIQASIQAIQ